MQFYFEETKSNSQNVFTIPSSDGKQSHWINLQPRSHFHEFKWKISIPCCTQNWSCGHKIFPVPFNFPSREMGPQCMYQDSSSLQLVLHISDTKSVRRCWELWQFLFANGVEGRKYEEIIPVLLFVNGNLEREHFYPPSPGPLSLKLDGCRSGSILAHRPNNRQIPLNQLVPVSMKRSAHKLILGGIG